METPTSLSLPNYATRLLDIQIILPDVHAACPCQKGHIGTVVYKKSHALGTEHFGQFTGGLEILPRRTQTYSGTGANELQLRRGSRRNLFREK